ncbi:MAG: sulfite exporter TauE/SafE family protein [Proteobacteria bacterium]|jgi:hypothetical protein|nr:sulfite exporter TauE/SafE family protein [Pseudomonadota bacterium]
MDYLTIGFVIGSVLGLTGSGGALVAIPLFMYLGLTIKEASFLSLIAVVLAGAFNLLQQYRLAQVKNALLMIAASLLGSVVFIPVKEVTPNLVIVLLLTVISLYSLVTMWLPKKTQTSVAQESPTWLSLVVGVVLGGLTTLTGLGGGVLLMPIFVGIFKMPMTQALATSLVTILGSSFISFLLQWYKGAILPTPDKILFLIFGIALSTFVLKQIMKRLSPPQADLLRKWVFSGIVVFAMIKFYL